MADHYQTLGLTYKATPEEIKLAYRKLAKKHHPDVSKEPDAEEQFIKATEAYEILSDPSRKARYDFTKDSPSPRTANKARQQKYEEYVRKQQRQARRRAKRYAKTEYKKFDHEYFETYSAYVVPKVLGCFGIAFGMLVVCIILGLLLFTVVDPENSAVVVVFVLGAIFTTGTAYLSTRFDMWHNAQQKKRKRK